MKTKKLVKLSESLLSARDDQAERPIIRLFVEYMRTLRTFKPRTEREQELIEDYEQPKKFYRIAETPETTQQNNTTTSPDFNETLTRARQPYLQTAASKIDLDELVVSPPTFNGYSPWLRDWIGSYQEAFVANKWSDTTARKYFPTLLREATLDWYQTSLVRLKLSDIQWWGQLKSTFVKHFLG